MNNPVAPVEGHYALLRNGMVVLIQKYYHSGSMPIFEALGQFRFFETGKSVWNDPDFEIIATISPADMQAIASGKVERLQEAVILARDTFNHYGDLHAAKPDDHKATANYKLAAKMNAALGEQNDG